MVTGSNLRQYNIKVKLILNKSIHIGSGQNIDEIVDIPITSEFDENGKRIPIVYGTVLKGILRNIGYTVAIHLFPENAKNLSNNYRSGVELEDSVKNHPFHTLFGTDKQDGKIMVSEGKIDYIKENIQENIGYKTGIHVHPYLQTVMHGALFTLEYVEVSSISFDITCLHLTEEEIGLLYGTINALKFHSIGGKRTTGMGIIEDVEILDENNSKNPNNVFIKHGKAALETILKKKGGKS